MSNSISIILSISFFSTFRIGYILKKINIPIRIAPKTKLAQFFYTHRILQKRSKSKKPEYEYNIDLVDEMFQIIQLKNIENIDGTPYLSLDYEESIKHIFETTRLRIGLLRLCSRLTGDLVLAAEHDHDARAPIAQHFLALLASVHPPD